MGDSSHSMTEYNDRNIELAPSSPVLQKDGESQWMDWDVAIKRELEEYERISIENVLPQKDFTVTIQMVSSAVVKLRVKQTPIANYTALYLASIRTLFQLE